MTLPAYAMNQLNFPEMYERFLVGPLFRPFADLLLARVDVKAGDSVLDIACGTGIVARLAFEKLGGTGRVVGVDLSPQMLAVAKGIVPGIDWREGNAEALPVRDAESFSVVLCQQGLQFVANRAAAVREMRRALAPRGRLAVATWCALEDAPFFRALHQVAERHLGSVVDQRHSLGNGAELESLLTGAGMRDVRVERVSRLLEFPDTTLLRLNTMALVGMSDTGKTMDDGARASVVDAIIADSESALKPFATHAGGLMFELSSNVAVARG
jgi:ubiquinone/menaquinone biosynthesis C-methylase UbiE